MNILYRGVAVTDDPANPHIKTAAAFDTRRAAAQAARRAARAAGYDPAREQLYAETIELPEEGDDDGAA